MLKLIMFEPEEKGDILIVKTGFGDNANQIFSGFGLRNGQPINQVVAELKAFVEELENYESNLEFKYPVEHIYNVAEKRSLLVNDQITLLPFCKICGKRCSDVVLTTLAASDEIYVKTQTDKSMLSHENGVVRVPYKEKN